MKRSGASEPFDRDKAVAGVRKACKGRPVTEDDLACLGQQVEDALRQSGAAEVPANEIGLAILGPLRDLDDVAYLRFSSVYKQFDSADDFEAEIAILRGRARRRVQPAELVEALLPQPSVRADHRPPGTSWGSGVPGAPPRCPMAALRLCRCHQQHC